MFYSFHADAGPSGVVACTWHCITRAGNGGYLAEATNHLDLRLLYFVFDVYSNNDRLLVTGAASLASSSVR